VRGPLCVALAAAANRPVSAPVGSSLMLHEPREEEGWRTELSSQMQVAASVFKRKVELSAHVHRSERRR
jgi:hypothetical protein